MGGSKIIITMIIIHRTLGAQRKNHLQREQWTNIFGEYQCHGSAYGGKRSLEETGKEELDRGTANRNWYHRN